MNPAQNTGFSAIPFAVPDVRGAEGPVPGAGAFHEFVDDMAGVGHAPVGIAGSPGFTESELIEIAFGNLCRALKEEFHYAIKICKDLRWLRELLCARGEPPEAAALRLFDELKRLHETDVLHAFNILLRLPSYDYVPLDLHAVKAKTYEWSWISQFPNYLWVSMREAVSSAIEGSASNVIAQAMRHPGDHPGA
ncbi:hypothetical protein LV28_14545 [Pandoraea pnomenusa]|uniref:Uncharacterized protein n=1 Tax=Pandoraea pnomenusa TaxID=93220 RepID=A0A378YPW0_9BURK|nr:MULTISPECIES: hypothetical protein [Pandoraea]AHB08737.1 hypothetical protein U875_23450 [Pandoraea pnomenusa 3kgm]AHB78475.1 hypothetical protein X636_10720 [Pandoraea pnomenusa]AHN77544.1 hypothetical protein DA70_16125 [Pandoraea pnomenusa]AIU27598.1 hypothetical protein LV28_14545 [Pandoraea pnomenusa]MBN9094488.1 hypothetical protein [Pandoraea pnomenusa]